MLNSKNIKLKIKTSTLYAGIMLGICLSIIINFSFMKTNTVSLTLNEINIVFPILMLIGFLAGSSLATILHKEFKIKKAKNSFNNFMYGFFISISIAISSYSIFQISYSFVYISIVSLIGSLVMILGVYLSIKYVKWRVKF
tara:strand:- start:318 stop:740 length:423 start_codon:yes stop_codon:yes gene_type:complete